MKWSGIGKLWPQADTWGTAYMPLWGILLHIGAVVGLCWYYGSIWAIGTAALPFIAGVWYTAICIGKNQWAYPAGCIGWFMVTAILAIVSALVKIAWAKNQAADRGK